MCSIKKKIVTDEKGNQKVYEYLSTCNDENCPSKKKSSINVASPFSRYGRSSKKKSLQADFLMS